MTATTATRGETLLCGDARDVLATLPAQSVHTCITSPPYFGLRAYNGGAQEIGTEQTPQEYVAALVAVFHEVYRVLRDDGLLWVVLGDSYVGGGGFWPDAPSNVAGSKQATQRGSIKAHRSGGSPSPPAKSLLGIPWRVAFALQEDGWILRQEVIWAKSNPMPESVKDRCTRGHETIFMLAKGPRYYYDADAIREQPSSGVNRSGRGKYDGDASMKARALSAGVILAGGRNKRSVWTVATAPFSSKKYGVATDHYAAFPPELVRPMVRASCPPEGVVLDCFCGSGTAGLVAVQEGRRFMGIDLNAAYVGLARARIATVQPALFSGVATAV